MANEDSTGESTTVKRQKKELGRDDDDEDEKEFEEDNGDDEGEEDESLGEGDDLQGIGDSEEQENTNSSVNMFPSDQKIPVSVTPDDTFQINGIQFLEDMVRYRSKYVVYPFETRLATEDFLNHWVEAPLSRDMFEIVLKRFDERYLWKESLHPQDKDQSELVKKIWLAEEVGTTDDEDGETVHRFLDRLVNNVDDTIVFLQRIIKYLPAEEKLPLDGIPPLDDLIKKWLKTEVPRVELEEVILNLKGKYSGIGRSSKRERITEKDQKAIGLVKAIWGAVNTNDHDDGSSTAAAGKG